VTLSESGRESAAEADNGDGFQSKRAPVAETPLGVVERVRGKRQRKEEILSLFFFSKHTHTHTKHTHAHTHKTHRWRTDEQAFARECVGSPGFALLSTFDPDYAAATAAAAAGNGSSSPLSPSALPAATLATARANFNKLCYKLQSKAVKLLVGGCLSSGERDTFLLLRLAAKVRERERDRRRKNQNRKLTFFF
jgi:hypothetical protein